MKRFSLGLQILFPLIITVACLTACYDVKDSTQFTCNEQQPQCPAGYECKDHQCVSMIDAGMADTSIISPVSRPPDAVAAVDKQIIDADENACIHPKVSQSCKDGWCSIPPGCFMMGSLEASDPCWSISENQHQVKLTHGFEIASTEVTQKAFEDLMGYLPNNQPNLCPDCPVYATQFQAISYCNALSKEKGLDVCYQCAESEKNKVCEPSTKYDGPKIYQCPGYRFPTDAEWEYAYRAGTQTSFYSGPYLGNQCYGPQCIGDEELSAKDIGWFCANAKGQIHPVGKKQPNGWGLYDMAGNLDEWCHDSYQKDLGNEPVVDPVVKLAGYKWVTRGGAFESYAPELRGSSRKIWSVLGPAGFRCVRTR